MEIRGLIAQIKAALNKVFQEVDIWFDKPASLRDYRPSNNGWTINEILEHISLTNHFLLKLIDKGVLKALKNVNNLDLARELENYTFGREKLDEIGVYKSFDWVRPEHMEPAGERALADIRKTIETLEESMYWVFRPNAQWGRGLV